MGITGSLSSIPSCSLCCERGRTRVSDSLLPAVLLDGPGPADEGPSLIRVRELTKTFEDPDGGEVAAVAGASLTCAAGEIYGLLGPNGAGKTTTLRCLATILTPTRGTATIAGHDLLAEPEAVRRSIGFLSASTGLYARLTPRETLRFFASLYGLAGDVLEGRVEET